jgi:hypothetical protein
MTATRDEPGAAGNFFEIAECQPPAALLAAEPGDAPHKKKAGQKGRPEKLSQGIRRAIS